MAAYLSCLVLLGIETANGATLNVLDFGARGDAIQIQGFTLKYSTTVTIQSPIPLSKADVGKLVILFGVGAPTSSTNQDLVAVIRSVYNATDVTISIPAGRTAQHVRGVLGSQNAGYFQKCVDACFGPNTVVYIPSGNYLMVPPAMLRPELLMPNEGHVWPAVIIQKGGIQFSGDGMNSTTLIGCGAWLKKGSYVHRGYMFFCQGPVTNNAPLIFENLTLDGGVANGAISNKSYAANVEDGTGWDETHGAILDIGSPPLHAYKQFRNCRVTHWRGEMFKSVAPNTDGFIDITNCAFVDGNASALNFSFSHHVNDCLFSNVKMAAEFYGAYTVSPSVFENSTIDHAQGGVILLGALINREMPSYTIRDNSMACTDFCVLLSPARNVIISQNDFKESFSGIITSGNGYQGTDCNGDVLVDSNVFDSVYQPICLDGRGADRMENMVVNNNTAFNCNTFAYGTGWGTNVIFTANKTVGGLGPNSTLQSGQWYINDLSNYFTPLTTFGVLGHELNIISYAKSTRNIVWDNIKNAVYAIDDASPNQIPPGAQITISHIGLYPVTLFLTSSMRWAPVTLAPNDVISCAWHNNTWILQNSPIISTPSRRGALP